MAKPSMRDVLTMIAHSDSAMAELGRVPIEEPRPPKLHTTGGLRGTLVVGDDGTAEDPGTPARTLADVVRDAIGEKETGRG